MWKVLFFECTSRGLFKMTAEILKRVHRVNLTLYKLVFNSFKSHRRKSSLQRPSTASFSSAGARARYVTFKQMFWLLLLLLKKHFAGRFFICFSRSITSYGAPQSKVNLIVEPTEVTKYLYCSVAPSLSFQAASGDLPFTSVSPVSERVFVQNHSDENVFPLQVHFHAN